GRSPCCEKAHQQGRVDQGGGRPAGRVHQGAREGCWRSLPKAAGLLRCGKSCRLRWINYLRPDLKRGNFTEEEDELIIKLHGLLGNKWSLIAGRLPGRTDNEIKNYWNTHIRRKLLSRGIDPVTHRPINDHASNITISFEAAAREDKGSVLRRLEEEEPKAAAAEWGQGKALKCPDLNLELCISPPCQEEAMMMKPVKRESGLCFSCSLGPKKSADCKCSSFLGLRPPCSTSEASR
ncbi:hypothetical protein BS78_K293700, partial [Paspalum vaginatum]